LYVGESGIGCLDGLDLRFDALLRLRRPDGKAPAGKRGGKKQAAGKQDRPPGIGVIHASLLQELVKSGGGNRPSAADGRWIAAFAGRRSLNDPAPNLKRMLK